jgi:HAE1 family hydrophobic/amphiphilic exporter-1
MGGEEEGAEKSAWRRLHTSMIKIFIERPVATAMAYLAVLVLGVYSFLNTPLELEPKENFPQVQIQTSWSGVPPEIVQSQVTAPLEEALSTIKGVRKIKSTSQIGLSQITLDFEEKANMEFANLALREEIAKTHLRLPYGLRPVVIPYVPEEMRVRPFLSYTISGNYSLQKLREMVKDKLEFSLGSVPGVSRVDVGGGSDPEIRVTLDKKKMKTYDIQPFDVIRAVQNRIRTYPSGKVKKGNQEFIFKVTDTVVSLREIGETIVAHSGRNPIALRDVAEVVPTFGDVLSIHRINGRPTISLTVAKEKGMNTLRVAREVKARLENIKKLLPGDLMFKTVDDESEQIGKNLRDLYLLAGIIASIVFLMIFVVLRRVKPSLLILSSIALSVVITFNLIYFFKISMNMLTLGALALGFGMFVDNSIVVFENILRLREKGLSPREAALQGPQEVFTAVLASTLTTMAVFFTFPYFEGRMKIYYLPLALVITSALAASLLVSFSLIPALAPRFIEKRRIVRPEKFRGRYEKFIKAVLRHPLEVILIVFALLYGSYRWFRSEVSIGSWPSWYSQERLFVRIGMPAGTDIEKTDTAVKKFEDKVMENDYEKQMEARIFSENAYITIGFPAEIENSYRPYILKEELIQLATQFAGVDIGVSGFDPQYYASSMGVGNYYGSHIKFYGYNLKKLKDMTDELEKTLKKNPRIKEVRIISGGYWWRGDSLENVLKIDKEILNNYDIDPAYLLAHIQALLSGTTGRPVARLRLEGKEIPLTVKFPDTETMNMRGLQDTLIKTRGGEYVRLGEISTFEERPVAGSIDRENQQFQQTVMWEFRGPAKAEERYRKAIFASLHLPAGFSASLEETWLMTREETGQIKMAFVFSLILIFMIMAALYESLIHPFVIMFSVPMALIGVFVAFIVAKYPFDATAYIGLILLSGIVVNNAILLVDHINLKRKQGLALLDAVVQGARERVRPIFMTTSTTVFGMLPMLLIQAQTGVKRQLWSTLALCTLGGLVSSTIFILIVIPIFYYHSDRIKGWVGRKIAELKRS